MKRILITGASGFIGSFIVEEALKQGYEVWAGMRATSSKRYLQHNELFFIELDFSNVDILEKQLRMHKDEYGDFDYIIHCAGATKCRNKDEFDNVNYYQTVNFVDMLQKLRMVPQQFIYISTISYRNSVD